MKTAIITFCLIGAVFAYPISFNALLDSTDSNSTESMSVSQSSENSTSEQSSEQSASNQSSESESVESTSEDTTSEESDSQSDESTGSDSMSETRDNSMSSEENVRKSWVQVFNIMHDLSNEDNSTSTSTEVTGQAEQSTQQPTHTPAIFKQDVNGTQLNQPLVDGHTSSSESAESNEATAAPSASTSESSSSSESTESVESTEESDSNSAEVQQLKATDCVNGTQSCESEEYSFNDIGDDAHHGVDNLMVPDDGERELTLRR